MFPFISVLSSYLLFCTKTKLLFYTKIFVQQKFIHKFDQKLFVHILYFIIYKYKYSGDGTRFYFPSKILSNLQF